MEVLVILMSSIPLQLLLFVDKRPHSAEEIREIRDCLRELDNAQACDLQVIDVKEQPHLTEYFRLVATPTLIKIYPEPRQTLAGSNLVAQIKSWWGRWQNSLVQEAEKASDGTVSSSTIQFTGNAQPIANTSELLRLSDEIFRLNQEKEQLQEQLHFKDRLISMLAHDLRNPLTATAIALETLEMGLESQHQDDRPSKLSPKMISQLLKHARTQTKSIDRMITDILQATRGSGVELQLQPQPLNLRSLCMDVFQHLQPQYQAKSQEVCTDMPGDLPEVYADVERVRQVLVNLLDNAIKYTPEGGQIRLSILHRTTQKVQVSICDDGPGIPEENQQSIFEDRFRLQRDQSTDGYGIGLALCQRIIRAHYGQIWVDSVVDQGSCFHFTLPVYRN
jgi:two-component system clock-associated histidine kinase SasA